MESPRTIAIELGEKWYFTGKPCKHGHIALRQVSNKGCKECSAVAFAKWEANNLSKRAADKRGKRSNDPERFSIIAKRSRAKNPTASKERAKKRYKAKKSEYIANNMRRKALLRNRMPTWADNKAIKAIYKQCAEITSHTGIVHHVDHYYPLRGKTVSGLHVHTNLQILTREQNMSKFNKCPG